jgi:hypothetical protein
VRTPVQFLGAQSAQCSCEHQNCAHRAPHFLCAIVVVLLVIVVDDNNNGVGKGQYVSDFLNNSNDSTLLFDDYQIGYIKL